MGSTRYLTSSSWNLVNNYEGIHELAISTDIMIKNAKLVELNTNIASVILNIHTV